MRPRQVPGPQPEYKPSLTVKASRYNPPEADGDGWFLMTALIVAAFFVGLAVGLLL